MIVSALPVGPLQENAYVLVSDASGDAVLIDPGDEGERLVRAAESLGGTIRAIWLTHAHMDHVGGIAAVKRIVDVPIHLHPLDRPLYDGAAQHALLFGLRIEQPPPPERELAEGDVLSVGELEFDVWHVPGHAPGHVALIGHGVAFVGDCLFAGSVGRTDLPLSNPAALNRSLQRLCTLPDDTIVYTGHGPETTIARERASNPFLSGAARLVERPP
ncbi:MAG TPA: MBL fold metallo-hydrolase [Gemmatimonadaceae bacterium]|nr:MBL fold metallo-hydrolase [Gemmatimonadaceae bacterium]